MGKENFSVFAWKVKEIPKQRFFLMLTVMKELNKLSLQFTQSFHHCLQQMVQNLNIIDSWSSDA